MGGKPHQDWCMKPHSPQIPNSQAATLKAPNQQQHQSQTQQPPGGLGRSGGPPTQNQNQNSGWTAGPIPQIPVGPAEAPEPSGWEEPSPQSISRKMEIDDGTSAWGDPTCYNSKNVNLWDKNSAPSGPPPPLQGQTQQGPPTSVQQPPPRRQPAIPANHDSNPGNAPGMGKLCPIYSFEGQQLAFLANSLIRSSLYYQAQVCGEGVATSLDNLWIMALLPGGRLLMHHLAGETQITQAKLLVGETPHLNLVRHLKEFSS